MEGTPFDLSTSLFTCHYPLKSLYKMTHRPEYLFIYLKSLRYFLVFRVLGYLILHYNHDPCMSDSPISTDSSRHPQTHPKIDPKGWFVKGDSKQLSSSVTNSTLNLTFITDFLQENLFEVF